ncbi:Gfo/Idh/MocA family protein [Caldicellulosiruptor morganii]|uniref:Gfo/Idh/MocA family oxidoreductase n=1 Tax=Caldicellulosiruptor morganii TaxID=1387555 RepID=A0ABY7BLI6_9FIRM|nr:Gfo/Idh/MocA family oxidoreductase [Caldicellulosiruptor morganii]WAM33685.1 Gfo/Idh/MocA family oxidoreductase [Caldicellulosiruptor morganii]
MTKTRVAIMGCGNIAPVYVKNLKRFGIFEIVACADVDLQRAKGLSSEFSIKEAVEPDRVYDLDVDIVVNLTPPQHHYNINKKVLESGKHLYSEKPLCSTVYEAKEILEFAQNKGLIIGCAPDTFLGANIQTAKKLIQDGWIGKPFAANCFVMYGGPEKWHPNPHFIFKKFMGPLFDIGPYCLTALVFLLGSVKKVSAMGKITFNERLVTSEPHRGEKIVVEMPTYVTAKILFEDDIIGNVTVSYDVPATNLRGIEIYGEEGTLIVPDPNFFDYGRVLLKRHDDQEFKEVPVINPFNYDNLRGLGILDMALAIRLKTPLRASGSLAFHVLETLFAIYTSLQEERFVDVQSKAPDVPLLDMKLLREVLCI